MRRTAAMICAATLLVAPAAAGAQTVMGAGALRCVRWVEDRKGDDYFPTAQWVLGYLSRADRAYRRDLLHPVRSTDVVAWLDRYCAAHPDDDVETAAFRLEADIAARPQAAPGPAEAPPPRDQWPPAN